MTFVYELNTYPMKIHPNTRSELYTSNLLQNNIVLLLGGNKMQVLMNIFMLLKTKRPWHS